MTIPQLYEIYLRHPSIRTDTRQLKPGDLFFALKGPSFNGNQFATRALEQGAAYAIIDENVPQAIVPNPNLSILPPGEAVTDSLPPSLSDRLILVPDVLTALQDLSLHHRRQFNIPFIAITGSNGKTTTKELIHAVLSSTYITYTTQGNLNNHIGIPLTLLSVRPDAQFAVIEMGANHQKEIEGYCRYALPTHGIITNVGKAHLEGFGGPEGVKKGKGELFDFLRSHQVPTVASPAPTPGSASPAPASTPGGTAFVMWDYDYLREMSHDIPHIIRYGTHDADVTGTASSPAPASPVQTPANSPAQSSFLTVEITHGAATGPIHTQLVGDYNLPNVLVAVTIGRHFGVPDDKIRAAIEQYTPSNSRSQLIERDSNHIILDAYNANPSSMRAAIDNFARLPVAPNPSVAPKPSVAPEHPAPPNQSLSHKVLILCAMAELGLESFAEHEAIIQLISKYQGWKHVVLVGGDFQKINHPFLAFDNSKEAAAWLRGANLKDTYLLVKGSRAQRMEDVLAD